MLHLSNPSVPASDKLAQAKSTRFQAVLVSGRTTPRLVLLQSDASGLLSPTASGGERERCAWARRFGETALALPARFGLVQWCHGRFAFRGATAADNPGKSLRQISGAVHGARRSISPRSPGLALLRKERIGPG